MRQSFFSSQIKMFRNSQQCFLAFSWILGFIFGIILSYLSSESVFLLMRSVSYSTVSIVALLITSFLPFLITIVAIFCSFPSLARCACFLQAFLLSFISLGIRRSIPHVGWVISGILLADRWLCTWCLYRFWLRCSKPEKINAVHLSFLLCMFILIECLYFYYILPFTAHLINT